MLRDTVSAVRDDSLGSDRSSSSEGNNAEEEEDDSGTDAIKYHDVGNEDVNMYRTVMQSGVMSLCANRPAIARQAVLDQVARCISDDEEESIDLSLIHI